MIDTLEKWANVPATEVIDKTIESLKANGIEGYVARTREDALAKIHELIPVDAEIMTMTSVTLHELGLDKALNDTARYQSVREKLNSMDKATQASAMRKLGAAPEYVIGSVHAVTENGQIVIASNTGSQLPAEAYGAAHVVFVVGAQKIVADLDAAIKRIYEYTLPLESKRAHEAYGVPASFVSKLLIINREVQPGRMHVVFVPENIGF